MGKGDSCAVQGCGNSRRKPEKSVKLIYDTILNKSNFYVNFDILILKKCAKIKRAQKLKEL